MEVKPPEGIEFISVTQKKHYISIRDDFRWNI